MALLLTFGRRGLVGAVLDGAEINLPFTIAAVVLAQTFVAAPFYIRAVQIGFSSMPRAIDAAIWTGVVLIGMALAALGHFSDS